MASSEREDLQELLSIPGFTRFANHILHEYTGEGYRYRVRQALKKNDLVALQVTEGVATMVEEMLAWPAQRIEELKAHPEGEDD